MTEDRPRPARQAPDHAARPAPDHTAFGGAAPGGAAAARQERIRRLLADRGFSPGGGSAAAQRFPRLGPGPHPLSPSQRRMWFAQQRDPASGAYNICAGFRITGELDPDRLRHSFEAVVARQDILRTVYRTDADGMPVQLVRGEIELRWETADASGGVAEADRLATEFGRGTFDLAEECPLRLLLIALGPAEHVLVLVVHHIAVDDLSWAPLFHDVAAHYRADEPGPLPPVRYAEFARWDQERASSDHHAESLEHWRRTLTPWPAPVALPVEGGAARGPEGEGVRRKVLLSPGTSAGIIGLAKSSGASLFMTTLACVTAVLRRYSAGAGGTDSSGGTGDSDSKGSTDGADIAVGTVTVNRSSPELEPLIGNFGNTVMLRFAVDDPLFPELLAEVQRVCMDAFGQQEVPFDQVVQANRPPRRRDGSGLFNVMFTQRGQTLPPELDFPGLRWREHPVFNGSTRFDLAVEVVSGSDGLTVTATGAHRVFDADGLDRLLGHVSTLMDGVVADPARRIGELPLLPAAEYERVVHEWNATDRREYLPTTTLPGLFAEQVRLRPDAVAVVEGDRRLDYRELDGRANQLARHLIAAGVRPGDYVGVLLERSVELIVAMLAALKAGAAFVPLDPAWPALRKAELISAAGLAACVTTAPMLTADELAAVSPGTAYLDPTAEATAINRREREPVRVETALDDIAYVVYTSGSTGVPKGAMITHRGIVNRLPWQADLLGLTESDAVLHKAPVSFDISINEIFLPLVSGAGLVLAKPGGEGDVSYLLATIADHGVTFVYLVSSMLDLMVERDDAARALRGLRHVWCGGEVLTADLYARFRRQSEARMYHGYGPAEATIGVTCRVYESADQVRDITIGRPNPNARIYLLDRASNPVPAGVVGEIHIGGLPLARGYLNDPERTAERFVRNPFRDGERLYRTGDLARYRADGQIEFVGRADNQVKIAGRRIELEEIESKLSDHPLVRQAAVLTRTEGVRGEQLIAFVAAPETEVTPDGLRAWLGDRLPSYMVPPTVVPLPELPLRSSGKLDRKALEAMRLPEPTRRTALAAPPEGTLQRAVAEIWARTLGLERVGAEENFFDLGGHSVLVVKVQTEIRRELGHDIAVVALFENPTVAAVARFLETGPAAADDEEAAELRRVRERAGRQRRVRAGRGRPTNARETT
ncbi:amino acid adenylation domain-containing protein [Streptomyces sp. NPDC020965]|uniref:amino acid adenylation domain-containing protein n=1 Tax=Streptomyces sp. NPDC020965 TaxID=3365105 RepID=UPI0037B5E7D9